MGTTDGDWADRMSEWPDDWFRDGQPAASAGAADKTVSIPAGGQEAQPTLQHSGAEAATPGAWPQQPPANSAETGAPPASPYRTAPGGPGRLGPSGWRRWVRPRRIIAVLAVVIALLLAGTVGSYFYLNSKLNRANVLVSYPGRPALGAGTNWLIAGSDSRQGLTKAQEREYSTGYVSGGRSDTIMILHVPANGGRPVLVSVPRDSYVDIPGYGYNKINAAFAFGGPALLAKTIQTVTGLYINHFMDIGFGGFVRVVNDVGGVRMCLITPLRDAASGINLKKGCHNLNGGQALAYVRDRHSFATEDLQREQDQRLFLKALLSKMTSLGVMLNPFRAFPAASSAAGALTVDQSTNLYNLVQVAMALRDPITTTVPIANANYSTAVGDSVLWNSAQAKQLFNDLRTDTKLPKYLVTGSRQL